MAGAASQAGDADSSWAPGLTSPWMSTVVLFVGVTVTLHQFFCILHNQSDFPPISWPWYRAWPSPIMSGFHGAFATGVACQQGTLTLPDTWFRPPFWDLLMLQLLRLNSSNLPCLYSTFPLEYPLVLSRFCLVFTPVRFDIGKQVFLKINILSQVIFLGMLLTLSVFVLTAMGGENYWRYGIACEICLGIWAVGDGLEEILGLVAGVSKFLNIYQIHTKDAYPLNVRTDTYAVI